MRRRTYFGIAGAIAISMAFGVVLYQHFDSAEQERARLFPYSEAEQERARKLIEQARRCETTSDCVTVPYGIGHGECLVGPTVINRKAVDNISELCKTGYSGIVFDLAISPGINNPRCVEGSCRDGPWIQNPDGSYTYPKE